MSHTTSTIRGVDEPWHPWRDLRGRTHLAFHVAPLPAATGGAVHVRRGDRSLIILDPNLTQVERRCALAHELVHDERGGGCDQPGMPDMWAHVALREERRTDDEAVRRLVPPAQLLEYCVRIADAQGSLGPAEVADEFNVTIDVAERALLLLGQQGGPPCASS
jgi:hypothetical protein